MNRSRNRRHEITRTKWYPWTILHAELLFQPGEINHIVADYIIRFWARKFPALLNEAKILAQRLDFNRYLRETERTVDFIKVFTRNEPNRGRNLFVRLWKTHRALLERLIAKTEMDRMILQWLANNPYAGNAAYNQTDENFRKHMADLADFGKAFLMWCRC